jgi:hypothetical protein
MAIQFPLKYKIMKRKYQPIIIDIPAGTDPQVSFQEQIDNQYPRIVEIIGYTSTIPDENKNLEFVNALKVANEEVFCEGFDTHFIANEVKNQRMVSVDLKDVAGATFEGRLKYNGTLASPIRFKFLLTLTK